MDLSFKIIQSSLEPIEAFGINNMQLTSQVCYTAIEEPSLVPSEPGAY